MAEGTVIRAEVILRTDGVPPQTNLDLICASAAGAYGPTLKEVATTGLDWIAANLRYMRQFDGPGGPQWAEECEEFGCHDDGPIDGDVS